jgi:thiol-disulfide isomerase/thioredoxin
MAARAAGAIAALALAVGAAAGGAPTAGETDARALLERVSATYREFSSFRFEGVMTTRSQMGTRNQSGELAFLFAAAGGRRFRLDMHGAMLDVTRISDGDTTWTYAPSLGQYTREATRVDSGATLVAMTNAPPLLPYLDLSRNLVSATRTGQETLEASGRAIPCDVVEAIFSPPAGVGGRLGPVELWIDRVRGVVLRDERSMTIAASTAGDSLHVTQRTDYALARLGEALPDTLFRFAPPPGAKEAVAQSAQSDASEESPLRGKPAPDFSLHDLAGKPRHLAALRGQVVMLDFWATWCGPCRAELPTVVKLATEYKRKGLVVWAVNVRESAALASGFMKRNHYPLDVLLDHDGGVTTSYGAVAIPTLVVIDRKGVVAAHFVGLHEEADLRAALKLAGLQ